MNRIAAIGLSLLFFANLSPRMVVAAPSTGSTERKVESFFIVELGASSEGNDLFMRNMGIDPELLGSFAPARFEVGPKGFKRIATGGFSYEASSPSLVEKSGGIALYSIRATVRSPKPPKPEKTVKIEMKLADFAGKGDVGQPGSRAMELGARQLGWTSGSAWIIEMKRTGPGKLLATVGFSRG